MNGKVKRKIFFWVKKLAYLFIQYALASMLYFTTPMTAFHIQLGGFIGNDDFDLKAIDNNLEKNLGKQVSIQMP